MVDTPLVESIRAEKQQSKGLVVPGIVAARYFGGGVLTQRRLIQVAGENVGAVAGTCREQGGGRNCLLEGFEIRID